MNWNKRGKKAQLTIFIIIAIVIVGVLLIVFLPRIRTFLVPSPPEVEIKNCLQQEVPTILNISMSRGGSLDPEFFYGYNGEKVEYLCYTSKWYDKCTMQKPLLKQAIEAEVEFNINQEVKACLQNAQDNLESRGYEVEIVGDINVNLDIVPDNVLVSLDNEIIITKGETGEKTIIQNANFRSEAYKLIMIASSILNWEARYGDSAPETYMGFYPDVKVEKKKQSEGTTIYIITHRETGEVLRFASRSVAWPPGYALPDAV